MEQTIAHIEDGLTESDLRRLLGAAAQAQQHMLDIIQKYVFALETYADPKQWEPIDLLGGFSWMQIGKGMLARTVLGIELEEDEDIADQLLRDLQLLERLKRERNNQ